VELPRFGTVKTFPWIVSIPAIEIGDLWSVAAHDTEELSRRDGPGPSVARRDEEFLYEPDSALGDGVTADGLVQGVAAVFRRQLLDGVTRDGLGPPCQGATILHGARVGLNQGMNRK